MHFLVVSAVSMRSVFRALATLASFNIIRRNNVDAASRFIVNIFIAIAWLYGFDRMGWITVHSSAHEYWLTLGLIALATVVVRLFLLWIMVAFSLMTCGFGFLLTPIIAIIGGWICLWGAAANTLFMSINVGFWWTGLIMSIVYGMIRVPTPKKPEVVAVYPPSYS